MTRTVITPSSDSSSNTAVDLATRPARSARRCRLARGCRRATCTRSRPHRRGVCGCPFSRPPTRPARARPYTPRAGARRILSSTGTMAGAGRPLAYALDHGLNLVSAAPAACLAFGRAVQRHIVPAPEAAQAGASASSRARLPMWSVAARGRIAHFEPVAAPHGTGRCGISAWIGQCDQDAFRAGGQDRPS